MTVTKLKRLNANNNKPYLADKSVPLEHLLDFDEWIELGRYVLHPHGGQHGTFYHTTEKVKPLKKYKLLEFPWVEDLKPHDENTRRDHKRYDDQGRIMAPINVGASTGWYSMVNLMPENAKHLSSRERIKFKRNQGMHRIVAAAYCENVDFLTRTYTDHINKDKQDYRICNLRWITPQENAIGWYGARTPDENYKLYMEQHDRVKESF